jgi:hypothetical protein
VRRGDGGEDRQLILPSGRARGEDRTGGLRAQPLVAGVGEQGDAGYQGLSAQTAGAVLTPRRARRKNQLPVFPAVAAAHEADRRAHAAQRIRVERGISHLTNWRALSRHLGRREHLDTFLLAVAGLLSSQERTPRPEQHHGNREHYRPAPPGERPRTDRVNDRPPRPCTSSFRRRRNVPARAARKGRDRVPRTRRRSPDAPTGAEESRGVAAPAIVTKPSRPYGVCVRPVGSSPIGEPRRMAPSHTPRWVRAGNPIRAPGVSPIHRAWLGGG